MITVTEIERIREDAYRYHTSDGRDFGAFYVEPKEEEDKAGGWDAEWSMDMIEGARADYEALSTDLEVYLNEA